MTRDEAIEIFGGLDCFPRMHGSKCAQWIDAFAALGMLKLEEPKSAEERATQKALDALHHAGWDNHVLNVLDRVGLKIVEK